MADSPHDREIGGAIDAFPPGLTNEARQDSMGRDAEETAMDLPAGLRLSAEENPSWEDRETVDNGLGAFNAAFLRDNSYDYFGIFVRDEARAICAGLIGHVYAGWLFVNLLWVADDLRRGGIGRGLLAEAERRAVALGCHSAWLDTFSFQAPEFYRKLGYREFARLDYPPNHQRIFLKKELLAE